MLITISTKKYVYPCLSISGNLLVSRLMCQIIGLFYMFLFYSGTSLHGGIKGDTEVTMVPNFFLTYLLCNKVH